MKGFKILSAATAVAAGVFALCEAKASRGDGERETDYLLILGYRIKDGVIDEVLKMRVSAAAEYLKKHGKTVAVCCGGKLWENQPYSEAEVIGGMLTEKGIAPDRIILEDKSKTTRENFLNAKRIIASREGDKEVSIAFISSDYHLMRAKKIAERCGVKVMAFPAESPKNQIIKSYLRELVCFPMVYIER